MLVIKFRIRASLRFLSHAEMLRVFQRAFVRAGLRIEHSQGFNPRPKLSLPLPRTVGIETDDDLLCVRVQCEEGRVAHDPRAADFASRIKVGLSAQLPAGCELLSVSLAEPNTSFQPCFATYVLPMRQEYVDDRLTVRTERLLASESLSLRRQTDGRNLKFKDVDVRPFLKSIELDDKGIVVECVISSAGSIRVDEILNLLELDVEKLAGPVRRANIEWKNN